MGLLRVDAFEVGVALSRHLHYNFIPAFISKYYLVGQDTNPTLF